MGQIPNDAEHGDLEEIIGALKDRIEDTKEKVNNKRQDGIARYFVAILLTAAFVFLPIMLFGMTHSYNQQLISQLKDIKNSADTDVSIKEELTDRIQAELMNPNEVLTATFSYASAPLAFMLGYYFNKTKREDNDL